MPINDVALTRSDNELPTFQCFYVPKLAVVISGSDYFNTIDTIRQYQPKAKLITNGISISRSRVSGAEKPIDRCSKPWSFLNLVVIVEHPSSF
ncbi:MAG: hypothetical protein KH037_11030 [Burkholderiales bacterium]|nr:hypothetical protein [Burkholderiales bacterium]